MKQLKNILIAEFVLFFTLYLLVSWLIMLVLNKPIDWLPFLLIGFLLSFVFSFLSVKLLSSALKPMLSFLNSDVAEVPAFGNKYELAFMMEHPDFSFEALKFKVAEKNVITFFDKEQKVLKFRTRFSPVSFGVGGFATFNADNKILQVVCFPIVPFTSKSEKVVQDTLQTIEKLAKS